MNLGDYWAIASDFDERANEALTLAFAAANRPRPCDQDCPANSDGRCEHERAAS